MSNRRRSQRVLPRIPVQVIARGPDNVHVYESTNTVVVSAHGALINLNLPVTLGQVIVVKIPKLERSQLAASPFATPMPIEKSKSISILSSPLPISGAFPSRLPIGRSRIPKLPAKLSGFLAKRVTIFRQPPAPQTTA
jgi:hypothetical protein